MAQGKVERLGRRESLRMEKNALRASTESPLRARSAMTVFQLETLVLSTYLPNMLVRLAVLVCHVEYASLRRAVDGAVLNTNRVIVSVMVFPCNGM